MEHIILNNGVEMPVLGYGTYQTPPRITEKCVAEALRLGGRGIIGTNQRKPSKIKGLQMI